MQGGDSLGRKKKGLPYRTVRDLPPAKGRFIIKTKDGRKIRGRGKVVENGSNKNLIISQRSDGDRCLSLGPGTEIVKWIPI